MQSIVNSLAVLAFLGTVISLFALSALLRVVNDLKRSVLRTDVPSPVHLTTRTVSRFASQDGQPSFVLAVTESCPSCVERVTHLKALAQQGVPGHLILLSAAAACADWVAGSPIEAVIDAELLGQIAIGAAPALIKYSQDGTEEWRRVAGSDKDLGSFLGTDQQPMVLDSR